MKNIFYVSYDDDRNVIAITREVVEGYNYFPIEPYKVKDFILGTKSIHSYYVRYDGFNNYFLEEKKFIQPEKIYKDIYEIKETSDTNDVTVFHNKNLKKWKFIFSEETKEILENTQYSQILKFYIASKFQYNFLIRSIEFEIRDLINDSADFEFCNHYESDPDKITLFTKNYFKKIGIKYV